MTSIPAAARSSFFGVALHRRLAVALTSACGHLAAQPVQIDPAFTPTLLNDVPALTSLAFAPLTDGSLLVRGDFTHLDGTASDSLALLKSSGAPDPTFAAAFARRILLAAPLPDGRIVAVTAARDSLTSFRLERLLANGLSDSSYPPIDLPSSSIARFVPQPDGRVLVVGSFTTLGSIARTNLARLRTDGTLDPTFDAGTHLGSSMLINAGLAAQPDGKVLFNEVLYASSIVGPAPGPGYHLLRLNADGSPDSAFGIETLPNGVISVTYSGTPYHALAVLPDGAILAATGSQLVRFTTVGIEDATFSPAIPGLRRVDQIVALPDGRSLVQARVTTAASNASGSLTPSTIFLLDANGAVLRDFRTRLPADSSIELLAAEPDGRFLVRYGLPIVGYSSAPSVPVLPPVGPTATVTATNSTAVYLEPLISLAQPALARFDLAGHRDAAFAPRFTLRSPASVAQLTADSSGRLLAAGSFTSVEGQRRAGLARFLADGSLDASFVPSPGPSEAASLAFVQPDGKILLHETVLGPKNDDGVFSLVSSYERLRADGRPDPTFNPTGLPADATLHAIDLDGRFLASGFEPDAAHEENLKLFRLNSDGSRAITLSTTFAGFQLFYAYPLTASSGTSTTGTPTAYPTGLPNQISGVQPLPGGTLYVSASVAQLNGAATTGFVRLNADGSTDTSYAPDIPLSFNSIVQPAISFLRDGRLLVGASRSGLASSDTAVRLLADGTRDPSFTPLPDTYIYEAIELSDGSLLTRSGTRRWLPDGLPDLNYRVTFNSSASNTVAVEASGHIYLGGNFSSIDDQPRVALARLTLAETPGFTAQPQSQTIVAGRDVTFQAALGTSAPATYQWTFNGEPVAGAADPTLILQAIRPSQAGDYRLVATTNGKTYTSDVAKLTVTPNTSRLVNFSARSQVSADRPPQIAGFVLRRGSPHPVLLRAVGRGLSFLLRDTVLLPEPLLRLYEGPTAIAENMGGILAPGIAEVAHRVGAFPVQADPVHDEPDAICGSALSLLLPAGAYTAHTSAADGRPGLSLFEFYDTASGDAAPAVANLSIRARSAPGADALFAGFVISGNGPLRLLLRGLGPRLTSLGVAEALADPQLTLYAGTTVLAKNDNWFTLPDAPALAATAQQVGAFALDPGSLDSALLVTLEPGVYSMQVEGVGQTAGEAMIELYVVEN